MLHLLLMLAPGLVGQAGPDAAATPLLRAAHDAFAANLAAFPFGRVRFEYVQGTARSEDRARAGIFDPRHAASGLYVFDGKRARYERVFPGEDLRATTTAVANTEMSTLYSFRMATSGDRTLHDRFSLKSRSTSLRAGRTAFDRDFQFPISLGQPEHTRPENLGWYLDRALRGDGDFQIAEVENGVEFEGRKTLRVEILTANGSATYWIDPERGAVPLKIVGQVAARDGYPGSQNVTYCDDLRHIPGRGWLPFKQSWWSSRDDSGGQILIREAAFDRPPARSAFALDYPEPISLLDNERGLRLPPRRSWDVGNLPTAGAPGVEKVIYSTLPMDAVSRMPGERESAPRYGLLILGLILLAATTALILLRRRMGRDS